MSLRSVAVKLKIPDNEAYTALTALRRLGVNVARVERAVVWQLRRRRYATTWEPVADGFRQPPAIRVRFSS